MYRSVYRWDKDYLNFIGLIDDFCRTFKETYVNLKFDERNFTIYLKIVNPVLEEDKNKEMGKTITWVSSNNVRNSIVSISKTIKSLLIDSGRKKVLDRILINKSGESMSPYYVNFETGVFYIILNIDNIKTKQTKDHIFSLIDSMDSNINSILGADGKYNVKKIDKKDIINFYNMYPQAPNGYFEERYMGLDCIFIKFNFEKMVKKNISKYY